MRDVPRSFKKPSAPAPLSPLDTGSLVSLSGHAKVLKAKLPATDPPALRPSQTVTHRPLRYPALRKAKHYGAFLQRSAEFV